MGIGQERREEVGGPRSSWFSTSGLPSQEAQHHHLHFEKVWPNLGGLVIYCKVFFMWKSAKKTLSDAQPQLILYKQPSNPRGPPRLKQYWDFSEIWLSGVLWKTEKKSLLFKRKKGWHFPQELHVLRVLFMTGRFWRHGPDQKTKDCTKMSKTFTSSSSSCWIPRSWSKLKSQSLACVKRGWF